MKNISLILLLFVAFSCTSKKEQKVIIKKGEVNKQSEMAALMLQMYELNLENKERILEGKTPLSFPDEFLDIHTAKLTDPSVRNADFTGYADVYIKTFDQVFSVQDSLQAKHNNTINSCIACHQTTCVGPIAKIEKLLIK